MLPLREMECLSVSIHFHFIHTLFIFQKTAVQLCIVLVNGPAYPVTPYPIDKKCLDKARPFGAHQALVSYPAACAAGSCHASRVRSSSII